MRVLGVGVVNAPLPAIVRNVMSSSMKIIGAKVETVLPHSKEEVLRVLSAPALFGNWHPWVERIAIFQQKGLLYRRSSLVGSGDELVEKTWQEPENDHFHFVSVQGLWADRQYRSRLSAQTCAEGCKVTWEGRMLAERPNGEGEQMEDFFREGFRGLRELMEFA